METAIKILIAVIVAVTGICGLLMTLCGGVFTVMAFAEPNGLGILFLSGTSFAGGLVGIWGAYKYFFSAKKLNPAVIAAKVAAAAKASGTTPSEKNEQA